MLFLIFAKDMVRVCCLPFRLKVSSLVFAVDTSHYCACCSCLCTAIFQEGKSEKEMAGLCANDPAGLAASTLCMWPNGFTINVHRLNNFETCCVIQKKKKKKKEREKSRKHRLVSLYCTSCAVTSEILTENIFLGVRRGQGQG